ncbi:hypothetical protein ABLE91_17055 [Aquabacter sp. CN5-332]|uniref:hypothetical protein n=1 Tax=Aquabacter sp. CN5-332 TaxID=3156608 RepID=UPI0032B50B31
MTFTECPPDVAAGDIVRCMSLAGLKADSPLLLGNVYTVRANEGLDDVEPMQRSRVPVIHLAGIAGGPYATFRFSLVSRRREAAAQEAAATAARMARVMHERVSLTGHCTEHDLARAGFTAAQILEFADDARGLAGAPSELAAA